MRASPFRCSSQLKGVEARGWQTSLARMCSLVSGEVRGAGNLPANIEKLAICKVARLHSYLGTSTAEA